jgi:hypothetical protein
LSTEVPNADSEVRLPPRYSIARRGGGRRFENLAFGATLLGWSGLAFVSITYFHETGYPRLSLRVVATLLAMLAAAVIVSEIRAYRRTLSSTDDDWA